MLIDTSNIKPQTSNFKLQTSNLKPQTSKQFAKKPVLQIELKSGLFFQFNE